MDFETERNNQIKETRASVEKKCLEEKSKLNRILEERLSDLEKKRTTELEILKNKVEERKNAQNQLVIDGVYELHTQYESNLKEIKERTAAKLQKAVEENQLALNAHLKKEVEESQIIFADYETESENQKLKLDKEFGGFDKKEVK